MKPMCVTIFIILSFSVSAFCADYYVSTAGSDSNPGTQEQPFATIGRALAAAHYGGYIHLDASTWNESPHLVVDVPGTGTITLSGNYNGPNGPGGKYSSMINGAVWLLPTVEDYYQVTLVGVGSVTVNNVMVLENFYEGLGACDSFVSNCNITGSSGHGVYCLIPNQNSRVIISDCDISACAEDGIHAPTKVGQKSARNPQVSNCLITNNNGSGIYFGIKTEASFIYPGEIHDCTIMNNSGDGVFIEDTTAVLYNNTVANNIGYGVRVEGENAFPDLGGGANDSPGNNTISGNGTYDLYKTGTQNVYVKNNHWDEATEAEMASGYQKRTNITRFYDAFDYWQPGDPLSGAFIWKSDFPKNGLLDFAASRNNKVQVSSVGQLKAVYAR